MPGNKKVFVSHTHEDNERCIPLLSALDAWGVDYWFDTEQLSPGSQLSDRIQQGLAERDIFLRVCTAAAQQSFWMDRELASVRGMRVDAHSRGLPDHRTIIFLILTPGYVLAPDEQADVVIDATGATRAATLKRLRDALGVPAPERRISRRRILGASVAGAVVVAGGAAAGSLYLTKDVVTAPPPVLPKGRLQPPTPQPAASRLKWFFKTAGGDSGDQNIYGLAAGGGAIYVAADDGVYALAASDGAIHWFQPKLTTSIYDVPVLAGDTLYVGAEDSNLNHVLAALNSADGSIRWTAPMSDSISSTPAISSDLIFVRDSKALHALRADGSPLWQLPIPEGSLASNESTPVIAGGVVYVGSGANAFYALDARSGAVLWRVPLKAPVLSSPTVANGLVYFGTSFGDAAVIALNIADGSQRWRVVDGDGTGAVDSSPVVAAGTVYIGSDQGVVYALDAATGKARWQVIPDKQYFDAVKTQPIVANGVVYVAIRAAVTEVTKLWALSAQDGSTLWQYSGVTAYGSTSVSPALGDGMVFFSGNGDHTVYALGV
jgi:outer membrane protein assembly factor BamB